MFLRTVARGLSPALVGALLATATPALLAVAPAPAGATSTYLCTGYTACASAGYSNAGYASHNDHMYWRMYSGHNCTNYVAYRMTQAGLPNTRPWSGNGNASNWGHAMADITDHTPSVGAVAWWDRGVPGAGSSGHVAYVEQVVSADEIVISEDSWSGDFHWRRLYHTGTGWPTGFIHFKDRPVLQNTVAPAISGAPQVGTPLTASTGSWKPTPHRFAYQWLADGGEIAGATASTFSPTVDQLGEALSVQVVGTTSGGPPVTATSAPSAAVAKGRPARVTAPAISGDPLLGQTLTATPGSYSVEPASRFYRWFAGRTEVQHGASATLILADAMVGKRVTVREGAHAPGYVYVVSPSVPSAAVLRGVITMAAPMVVSGTVQRGHRLEVSPGAFEPGDATVTYTWMRDGVVVPGVAGSTYPLQAADVGSRMGLRVELSKPDYRGLVRTFAFGGRVSTQPGVRVITHGLQRAATVHVKLAAPGVTSPGGVVRISVGRTTVTRHLRAGDLKVQLDDVRPGPHRVTVEYLGTGVILPATKQSQVTVRG